MSNEEILRKLALQVRNWGKWGADDEIGTLNYITPEKIVRAAGLVRMRSCLRRNRSVSPAPWDRR